jgi:hypothetical protein
MDAQDWTICTVKPSGTNKCAAVSNCARCVVSGVTRAVTAFNGLRVAAVVFVGLLFHTGGSSERERTQRELLPSEATQGAAVVARGMGGGGTMEDKVSVDVETEAVDIHRICESNRVVVREEGICRGLTQRDRQASCEDEETHLAFDMTV